MSDVLQSQQSCPSSHQLVSSPMFVHAAGSTLPGWEFPWFLTHSKRQTLGAAIICHINLPRQNLPVLSQKTLCSQSASNSPGVTRSCTSRRCNSRACWELQRKVWQMQVLIHAVWQERLWGGGWFWLQLWFVPPIGFILSMGLVKSVTPYLTE